MPSGSILKMDVLALVLALSVITSLSIDLNVLVLNSILLHPTSPVSLTTTKSSPAPAAAVPLTAGATPPAAPKPSKRKKESSTSSSSSTKSESGGGGGAAAAAAAADADAGNFSDGENKKKKKARTTFTGRQIFELEKQFEVKKYLSSSERADMAKLLNVTETQWCFVHLPRVIKGISATVTDWDQTKCKGGLKICGLDDENKWVRKLVMVKTIKRDGRQMTVTPRFRDQFKLNRYNHSQEKLRKEMAETKLRNI
ncbi:hypothetical protein J437_LFUL002559 [Ladona fulva]|uniref:Homeobox domain-containing protein n=1 Tax=Ladona fulva TaxID=123851 RepID=A0A8K0JW87_LADFU|nr:hypothetical protein J437_LFUL002559 [Ladona fulva]